MRIGPSTWVWFHPFHPFHPYGKPGVLYDPDEHPTNATVAIIKMVRCMTQSYASLYFRQTRNGQKIAAIFGDVYQDRQGVKGCSQGGLI